jgi:hypothetical protein
MARRARTKLEPQRTRVVDEGAETTEKLDYHIRKKKKNTSSSSELDIETECTRCHEIMELHSDFDVLAYYCEGCSFFLKAV